MARWPSLPCTTWAPTNARSYKLFLLPWGELRRLGASFFTDEEWFQATNEMKCIALSPFQCWLCDRLHMATWMSLSIKDPRLRLEARNLFIKSETLWNAGTMAFLQNLNYNVDENRKNIYEWRKVFTVDWSCIRAALFFLLGAPCLAERGRGNP